MESRATGCPVGANDHSPLRGSVPSVNACVCIFLTLSLLTACGRSAALETPRPAVAVEIAEVRATAIEDAIEIVGTLAARNEVAVKSEHRGVIVEIMVDEWIPVRAGQPLARLDMREIEARSGAAQAAIEMAAAQARAAGVEEARARRELERVRNLDPYGIVSRQEIENAMTIFEAAEARRASANAGLAAVRKDYVQLSTIRGKRVLTAPIDGVVSERNARVGDFVSDGTPPRGVFRIVDNRLLELTATASSRDASRIAPGLPIIFTSEVAPGETFVVPVRHVNPAIDPRDRSLRLFAEIPNETGPLRSGLFIKGRLIAGRRENVPAIPRAALLNLELESGRAEVFVVAGETAKRRAIMIGALQGELAEIREGLAVGERVVTLGGFSLRDGDSVVVTAGGR